MLATTAAQQRSVADLKSALVQKIVTLKVACHRSTLRFHADGTLQEPCPQGVWTLESGFRIDKLKLDGNRLVLSGKRIGFGWKSAQKQNFNIDVPLTVEVDFPQVPTYEAAASAVNEIFVRSAEDHATHVPKIWTDFLLGNKPAAMGVAPSSTTAELSSLPKRVRVSSGVAAGRITKKIHPVYPELAKQWRIEGRVVLRALIGTDGKIRELRILDPAGLGLDEEAAHAVQQWEYQPCLLKGEAVEVETLVLVTFELRNTKVTASLGSAR